MVDGRKKNIEWDLSNQADSAGRYPLDAIQVFVLEDIRDQLMQLNGRLHRIESVIGCQNTIRIPRILDKIALNTRKPKRKKKI
jgi:hypothetical protein